MCAASAPSPGPLHPAMFPRPEGCPPNHPLPPSQQSSIAGQGSLWNRQDFPSGYSGPLPAPEGGGRRGAVRVLVCTPDHTSSQRFLELLYTMGHLSDDVCVIQLVSGSAEVNSRRGVVTALQLRRDLGRVLKSPSLLLVTSYLCSAHLVPMLHREVFSLMLLDDA